MNWLIQSCLGLRWVVPFVLATCAGGTNCETAWVHDAHEHVWLRADAEARGWVIAEEDYYATPAVVCEDGARICTRWGCE